MSNVHLSYDPSIPLLGILVMKKENTCPHKHLNRSDHSSFLCNNQNWKQPKWINRWIKLWYIHNTEYYSKIKNNKLQHGWISNNDIEWKKPDVKKSVFLFMSTQNFRRHKLIFSDRKQICGCLRGRAGAGRGLTKEQEETWQRQIYTLSWLHWWFHGYIPTSNLINQLF